MDKEVKRRLTFTITGIIGVLALLVGVSFATFSSNLNGTQTNQVSTGCLKVEMTDNGSINMTNEAPTTDEVGLTKTPYTYTLSNTCTVDAYYTTTINVLNTSNVANTAKTKISLKGASEVLPIMENQLEETELVDETETNVVKTYKLDDGYIKAGETKTFYLRTWFDYDVTQITGSLENKIIVLSEARKDNTISYNSNTSGYYVLNKSKGSNQSKIVDYSQIAPSANQASGIVKVDGKFYYRGNPDNRLVFGTKTNSENITWRILSTNSDGSINIVSDELISNLTTFYNTNLASLEQYIKTTQTFCTEGTAAKTKVDNNAPTGVCTGGSSTTKIGTLIVDDLMYAGAKAGTANTSFYLAASSSYAVESQQTSGVYYAYTTANSIGTLTANTPKKLVITLKADTMLQGEGTALKPFYVTGTYTAANQTNVDDSSKSAPTIIYARTDAKWSNTNKQIKISASDALNDIAGYLVKSTNEAPALTDSAWEASTSKLYSTVNTYDNGTYYVFAKDSRGNISAPAQVVVDKVDKVAPTCTIGIEPTNTETDYKILTITSSEANIDENGYTWDGFNDTTAFLKVKENNLYTGHIMDLAGNKGTCTATVTGITEMYYVKYDPNFDSNYSSVTQSMKVGQVETIPDLSFSRTGYTLMGYSTDPNAIIASSIAGDRVQDLTTGGETITLYAVWHQNDYTISVVVNNGEVDDSDSSSKTVLYGDSVSFNLIPNEIGAVPTVSCNGGQTGTISNNILTLNNVSFTSTCTVTYSESQTVLYNDWTLIINERPADRADNITEHGAVRNTYPALSNSNAYVFNIPSNRPWASQRTYITDVELGQRIKPTSTRYWFQEFESMETGDFTKLDTSIVTDMQYMFDGAGLNEVSGEDHDFVLTGLSSWNVSNVVDMSYMFKNAGRSLGAINWSIGDLSNWNVSSVETMDSMFDSAGRNASTWNIGDLSDWNTSNVTYMQNMFSSINRQISFGSLDVHATTISSMFASSPKVQVTLNVYSNPTSYVSTFNGAATDSNASITVNYSSTTTNVDSIIATKSSTSHVTKGYQLN